MTGVIQVDCILVYYRVTHENSDMIFTSRYSSTFGGMPKNSAVKCGSFQSY